MTINGIKLDPVVPVQSPRQLNVPVGAFANEYDQYFRPGYDQGFNRAANQHWLETWGHGLVSRTASILPKVGQGFASILGAGEAIGSGNLSDIWDNPMMQMFEEMDESLKNTFPVYKSRDYAESGLLGKMMTASFWADDAFDGVAYAASSFVPGKAIGAGLQFAGKLKGLGKVGTFLNAVDESLVNAARTFGKLPGGQPVATLADAGLQKIDDVLLKTIARPTAQAFLGVREVGKEVLSGLRGLGLNAHQTNLLAATAYNTIAEASVEAFQIQKELELQLVNEGMSLTEAKAKASEAAARTFRANTTILGVPNLIQNMFFHGGWNKNVDKIRKNMFDASGDIAKVQSKDSLLKAAGISIGTEGFWEENAQTSVQQAERYLARFPNTDKSWEELVGSNTVNNIQGFFKSFLPFVDETPEQIEGATSIFLGSLVGGSAAAVGTAYQNKQNQKIVDFEKKRYDELITGEVGKAAANLMLYNVGSVHQKIGRKTVEVDGQPVEINEYRLDKDGNPVLDPKAIQNLYFNGLKDKALWDAYMVALLKNDPLTAEIIKQQALASYAYALAASGYDYSTEEIEHHLNKLQTIAGEEAAQLGVSTLAQDNIQTVKAYYQQIKDDAAKKGSLLTDANNPLVSQFNNHLVKTRTYLTAKKKALETVLPTTVEGVEGINKLLEDTNEYLRIIDQEASKLEAIYKETIFEPKMAAQEARDLRAKANRTPEEDRKLQQLIYGLAEDEYINGDWTFSGASRALPGGAEMGDLVRVTPGSRDLAANALGTTYSNLTRVESELEDSNASPITLARMLVNGVYVTEGIEDRLEDAAEQLAPRLNEDVQQFSNYVESLKAREQLATFLSEIPDQPNDLVFVLADLLNLPLELGTPQQIMEDPIVQDIFKWLNDSGIPANEETIFDEEFINSNAQALDALLTQLTGELDKSLKAQAELSSLYENLVNNTFPNAESLKERLSSIVPSNENEDLEGNLKIDHYEQRIEAPVKATIKVFNNDKDNFFDDQSVDIHISELEMALAHYENIDTYAAKKIVKSAQKHLDFIKSQVVPKLLENINNRAKAHLIYNNDLVHAALVGLGITSKTSEVRKLLEDIFGAELQTIVERVFKDQEVLSFDALGVLMQQAIVKGTKEQVQSLLDAISSTRQGIAEEFLNILPERMFKTTNNLRSTRNLEVRTSYSVNLILSFYFQDNMNDLVLKFMSDGDMTSFSTLVKISNEFNVEEKEFVAKLKKVYDSMNGLNLTEDFLLTDPQVFTKIKAAKEALKEVTPSLQQNIVLTQLLNFLFTHKPKGENLDNWILLKGIGGSGKTYLMSLLKQLYKQVKNTPNIYAFSSHQLASDNINNVLFGETKNSSLTGFLSLSNEEISKLNYVVIDEVYTLKDAEIELVRARLEEVKNTTKKVVKVVSLGDPSQVSASEISPLDDSIGTKFTMPLTTSYRTNVSAISSFIRKYQLTSNRIESPLAVSNSGTNITAESSGVVSATNEQLEELLSTVTTRSRVLIVSSPRLRDLYKGRGVDVKTVQEAQGYQWDEVFVVLDSLDLPESTFEANKYIYTAYSRAKELLVVAGTNAVNSVTEALSDSISVAQQEIVKASEMFYQNLKLANLVTEASEGITGFTTEELSPEPVQSEDEPKTELNTVSSPNYSDALEVTSPIPSYDYTPSTGDFRFSYPSNYGLKTINTGNDKSAHVWANSTGYIVRAQSVSGEVTKYYVLVESALVPGEYITIAELGAEDFNGPAGDYLNEISKKPQTVDLKAIRPKEFTKFPNIAQQSLGTIVVKGYNRYRTIYAGPEGYHTELIPGAANVIEDAIIRFYTTYYTPEPNGAAVLQTTDPTKAWVSSEIMPDGTTRFTVNWENIKDTDIQVLIPTNAKAEKELGWDEGKYNPRKEMALSRGVPYLVIKANHVGKDGKTTSLGDNYQLIRLQPKKFSRGSRHYAPIRELYDAVKVIEELTPFQLGRIDDTEQELDSKGRAREIRTSDFADFIRQYAQDNFEVASEKSTYRDESFHYFIRPKKELIPISEYVETSAPEELTVAVHQVVNLVFGAKRTIKYFSSEAEAQEFIDNNKDKSREDNLDVIEGHVITGIAPVEDGRNLFVLRYSQDPSNREDTSIFRTGVIFEGEGKAQESLNTIASANATLGEYQAQLRMEKTITTPEKRFKVSRAPSILISQPYTDYKALYRAPIIIDLLGEDYAESAEVGAYTKLLDDLEKAITNRPDLRDELFQLTGATSARGQALEFVNGYTTRPITVAQLEAIVGDSSFDENGDHRLGTSYLREPLQIHTLNNTGVHDLGTQLASNAIARETLGAQLRSNFLGVQKTSIDYGIPSTESIPTPEPPKQYTTVGELLETIRPTGDVELDAIVNLVKKLPIKNTKIFHLPQGIPTGEIVEVVVDGEVVKRPKLATSGFAASYSTSLNQWIIATVTKFENLSTDLGQLRTFLHETIHVATLPQLRQGQTDSRKGIKSPEALLYNQLVAIKKRFDSAIRSKKDPTTGEKLKPSDIYSGTRSKLDVKEFIANLANPTFIKYAKEIMVTPQSSKKSVLRALLDAIVDFFRELLGGNPSIYDAAVASLENYYGLIENAIVSPIPEAVPEEVIPEAKDITLSEIVTRVTNLLSSSDEFVFDTSIAEAKTKYGHILQGFPEAFGDEFTLKPTRSFLKLSDEEQLGFLQAADLDLKYQNFAYVDLPPEVTTLTPGALFTTKGIATTVDRLFKDENLSKREMNLLRSIIMNTVAGDSTLVEDLVAASNDPLQLGTIMLSRVFSEADKNEFSIELNTTYETYLLPKLFEKDNIFKQDFIRIVNLLSSKKDSVDLVLELVEDRNITRYLFAKNYVLNRFQANLDKDKTGDGLILTRREVIEAIKQSIGSPNPILPNGLTLKEGSTLLNQYYAELVSLRNITLNTEQISRYNALVTTLIPELEDLILGMSALKSKDSFTGEPILEKVIKEIYPKYSLETEEQLEILADLESLADMEVISRDDVDEEMLEAANIAEHIKKYNKSYELTLSESIKDALSHVIVEGKRISSSLAYIKTMQLVTSLDWSRDVISDDEVDIVDQLLKRLDKANTLDKAIINNLVEIIQLATGSRYADGVDLSTIKQFGLTAFLDPAKVLRHIAYEITDPAYTSNRVLTYYDVNELKAKGVLRSSRAVTETIDAFNWFGDKVTTQQFNRLFTREEAVNVLRGIMQTMGSMKETELYAASRRNKFGDMYTTFARAKSSGVTYSLRETIVYSLFKMHEENELTKFANRFLKNVNPTLKKTNALLLDGAPTEKEEAIKSFFQELGFSVNYGSLGLTGKQATDTANDIKGFLDYSRSVAPFDATVGYAIDNDTKAQFEFDEWIDGTVSGYLTRFSELLATNDDIYRNPSVKDNKGNKFYKFHESNFGYDTILTILDLDRHNPVVGGATGSNTSRNIPNFLRSSFYNNNIFVYRGEDAKVRNRIYSIGEFEGARSEDSGSVTDYTRQNKFFFAHTTFIQGFLDGLRQYGGENASYYQFVYTPSDKPKIPVMRVGLISDNDSKGTSPILLSIEQALKQIHNKLASKGKIPIVNYDASLESDLFRNFKIGQRALEDTKLPFTVENIPALAKAAYEVLEQEALEELKKLTDDQIQLSFDARTYSLMRKLHNNKKLNSKFPLPEDKFATEDTKDAPFKNKSSGTYNVKAEEVLPLFDLFYKNNYINSYFLNQLLNGDYAFYRRNSADIVKRNAGLWGPGIKGLVDPILGMKPTYRTLVLADTSRSKEDLRQYFLDEFYNGEEPTGQEGKDFEETIALFEASYDSTDAQGFMLPARVRDLHRGFERAWGLGEVHKPLQFSLEYVGDEDYSTAVPKYVKYSAINLSDELLGRNRYPILRKLREAAEILGVDEIVFNSAVKEGAPITKDAAGKEVSYFTLDQIVNLSEAQLREVRDQWEVPPIMELSNRTFRLQHNPAADPNKAIALPTQLIYFLNVYPDALASGKYSTTQEAAKAVYAALGELIAMGREEFVAEVTPEASFRRFLQRSFEGPGAERALDLLRQGISYNHPLLEKKSIIALASGLEKATVKIKFSGGKMVLQSMEGTEDLTYHFEDITDLEGNTKRILVTDAIVPKELLTLEQNEALARGESLFLMPDAIGFRIPTTETHSAVALRVKRTYSTATTNVIIVPKEVVPIHGSDFDVDALFVITREIFTAKETTVISGEYVRGYLDTIKKLFAELNLAQKEATPEKADQIKQLKRDIRRVCGLAKKAEEEDAAPVDQADTETRFKKSVEDLENFVEYDEAAARKKWGRNQGLVYKNNKWEYSNNLLGKLEQVRTSILEYVADNPEQTELVLTLVETVDAAMRTKDNTIIIGDETAPVGYVKEDSKYVFDPTYLETINSNLKELEEIQAQLQPDIAKILGNTLNSEIDKLKALKMKFLKNFIIEAIMNVVTDENNKLRQISPIAFTPLTDAIDSIPAALQPPIEYDLSSFKGQWEAYSATAVTIQLTGAFANGAKSFGYLARGGAPAQVIKFYTFIDELKDQIAKLSLKANDEFITSIDDAQKAYRSIVVAAAGHGIKVTGKVKPGVEGIVDALSNLHTKVQRFRGEFVARSFTGKVDTSPKLAKRYQFNIKLDENSKPLLFDSLAAKDARGKYKVTAVLDTLTNEAIDNLKRGDLVKARINNSTGSSVIALVSLGVPMDVIVSLLYQPILAPIAAGTVNNLSRWMEQIRKDYAIELAALGDTTIDYQNDLRKFLSEEYHGLQELSTKQLSEKLLPVDFASQLKAFLLLEKAFKVGEDLRALSNFLGILRKSEVFVENIFRVDEMLEDRIGKVEKTPKGLALVPRGDFSFITTDLFESAPHIKEAYITHQSLRRLIETKFKLHSPQLQALSKEIKSELDNVTEGENAQVKEANIRRSISFYLLSGIQIPQLGEITPRIITHKEDGTKYTLSALRTFSDQVASDIWALKEYDRKSNDGVYSNRFLKEVSINRDYRGISQISFRTGVNLNPEDIQNIYLGFKRLNRYEIKEDGEVIQVVPPSRSYISKLQKDLVAYAVLNYGLQFSTSNFSNYIPASLLKPLDEAYNKELNKLISLVKDSDEVVGDYPALTSFINHFITSHTFQNAQNVKVVPRKFKEPTGKAVKFGKEVDTYAGVEEIDYQKIYFDMKVLKKDPSTGLDAERDRFVKTGKDGSAKIYIRIHETDEYYYYTEVGRVKDAFHSALPEETTYLLSDYFNKNEAYIPFHYEEGNSVTTYSELAKSLKAGDEIWVYPTYNIDRIQRRKVKVTNVSAGSGKKVPGYVITYEPITSTISVNVEQIEEITVADSLQLDPKRTSFVNYNGERLFSSAVKNEDTGKYEDSNQTYDSVTGDVIPLMQTRPFTSTDTKGTRAANKAWQGIDPEVKLDTLEFGPVTKEQYQRLVDEGAEVGKARGTIFHKKIHFFIEGNPITETEIKQLYDTYNIFPSEFDWMDAKTMRSILTKTGTNAFHSKQALRTDKLYTERVITNPLLGWGGTADLVIDHGDNIYSIFDLKTGKAFNNDWTESFFKYGRTSTEDIWDTTRNRAKLQIMLYAFMAKANDPSAVFRNLELLHIPNRYAIDEGDAKRVVNVRAYLEIIEGYLQKEAPEKYKALKKNLSPEHFKALFDPATYNNNDSRSLTDTHPGADPAMELKLKILKLQSLVMYDKDIVGKALQGDKGSQERYKEIKELTEDIIKIKGDPTISYASWDTDMGWMDRWLGSMSYSTNPYVQLYHHMLATQKQKARNEYMTFRQKFDQLLRVLIKEKNLSPTSTWVGGVDRTKLFEFAYKRRLDSEGGGWRLKHSKDSEWNDGSLTELEKEFLTFANDSIAQFFVDSKSTWVDPRTGAKKALANRIVTYRERNGRKVGLTNLDLYNKSYDRSSLNQKKVQFQYYDGFFGKHAPQLEDVAKKHNWFSKEVLNFLKLQYTTNYFEATYEGLYNTDEAIPMKFLDNPQINLNANYSFNLELSLDNFVKQYYYKQHLDEVYAFGQGLKMYLEQKKNPDQGVTFDRMIAWFEDSIELHILGKRQKDLPLSSRSFGISTEKAFQEFNWAKFLVSLKNFFLGPTMWLKPFTGIPNAIFASLITIKEAVKNTFLVGSNANFTLVDLAYGFKEALNMLLVDGVTDKFRTNKAYVLMEKFGYLPDSYDWYTRDNQLLTAKNKLFTSRTLMAFHTLPEEAIATAIFVAQLRSMEFTKKDGTKTNVWDSYQVSSTGEVTWEGGIRGKQNTSGLKDVPMYTDVTDLTVEEVNSIKFLYEKMHGGYRSDERVAMEYYVWGQLMLQLKKYFPSILKNIWASRGFRSTQGVFDEETNENGEKILKWTPRVVEGRWRLLLGGLFNFLGTRQALTKGEKGNKFLQFLNIQYDSAYDLKNLTPTQRQLLEEDLKDFYLTGAIFIAMTVGAYNFWDDGEEDTLKKLYGRITNDFGAIVNPLEVMKNIQNFVSPIAFRKMYKLSQSSVELFWAIILDMAGYDDQALTREGNYRGWSEFQRNIHFLSSWHDLIKAIKESDDFSAILDERLK